jgi:hypothetical protein
MGGLPCGRGSPCVSLTVSAPQGEALRARAPVRCAAGGSRSRGLRVCHRQRHFHSLSCMLCRARPGQARPGQARPDPRSATDGQGFQRSQPPLTCAVQLGLDPVCSCDRSQVLEQNYRFKMQYSPDYQGMQMEQVGIEGSRVGRWAGSRGTNGCRPAAKH